MHGPDANLHIGRRTGDVLACNEEEWSRVDWVIAGPPCPPFSSIKANRAPEDDPGEEVFRKVTQIIIFQGRKSCFGFIVEMVSGFTHRVRERLQTDRQTEGGQIRGRDKGTDGQTDREMYISCTGSQRAPILTCCDVTL